MGNLVFLTNGSLDHLIGDEHGKLFVHPTNLIRPLRSHQYGWRLNEAMAPWETSPELAARSDVTAESACIWAAASRRTAR
jgi:hypothetical protein